MTVSAITQSRVQSAIARAAQRTGMDFSYLMGQARVESGLNPGARASTSSASGLYQFIEQSWLAVVKKHGAAHGLGWAADAIGRSAGGRMTVVDGATRQAILGLRDNPEVASLMAAEHASDNRDAIEAATGRTATGTDLYMAHFLGLGGAKQFLGAMQAAPDRTAAALFPAAARANRNVFYASDGSARSLSEVYQRFARKLGDGGGAPTAGATSYAARALELDGATVVTGGNESAGSAIEWATTTLARFGAGKPAAAPKVDVLRPTPDTARLAYLMLARMGG